MKPEELSLHGWHFLNVGFILNLTTLNLSFFFFISTLISLAFSYDNKQPLLSCQVYWSPKLNTRLHLAVTVVQTQWDCTHIGLLWTFVFSFKNSQEKGTLPPKELYMHKASRSSITYSRAEGPFSFCQAIASPQEIWGYYLLFYFAFIL